VHREEVYQRIQAEKLTNIAQVRSGHSPLRLLERSPESSESGLAETRLARACNGSEDGAKCSTSAHSVRDPTAQAYVEPSLVRGNFNVRHKREGSC
jgi:hypothetical protein